MIRLCHNHDCTYPYLPYPNLSMPIPSHQNYPPAPNATPEPSGSILSQLVSQQRTPEHSDSLVSSWHTPEHSDSLASSRCIPNPMLLRPFLFLASSWFLTSTLIPDPTSFDLLCSCVKSIPNVSLASRLWLGEARSCTSLAQCILVHLSSLSIYMFLSCLSRIDRFSLGPNEEGSKRGHGGSRGGRDSS